MNNINKFEDFLDRIRGLLDNAKRQSHIFIQVEDLEKALSEFEESEDNKIRKEFCKDIWNYIPYEKAHKYIAWLKKQGEQTPIFEFKASDWYVSKVDGKIHNIHYSVGNNESKFKVGDWIVGVNNMFKIISLNDELNRYIAVTLDGEQVRIPYYFDDGQGHMCSYHLWTIKDAKPGDILITVDGRRPFMYKCLDPDGWPIAYCGINAMNNFYISSGIIGWTDEEVCPAIKEQRDLLFSKMKETGYKINEDL